jgi:hypothetical protein
MKSFKYKRHVYDSQFVFDLRQISDWRILGIVYIFITEVCTYSALVNKKSEPL